MKIAKYLLLGSTISVLALGSLASCEKSASSQLSDTTVQFLKSMPNDAANTIKEIGINIDTLLIGNDGDYSVLLKNGVEINFDEDGAWRKVNLHKNEMSKSISDLLPLQTQNYLKANCQGKNIKRFERSSRNRYKVTLDGKEVLRFSRTGKFTPNDAKRLPSQATVTLKKYFADDAIEAATVDASYEYSVELASGNYIEFDRLGHFEGIYVPKGETVPAAFMTSMPKLLVKYLNDNYPGRNIKRIVRKDYGYAVKLSKTDADANDAVEICFSKTGDYLRNANNEEENEE